SLTILAFNGDSAAAFFDNGLANRQAPAGALDFGAIFIFYPIKFIENKGQIGGGNTQAIVFYFEQNLLVADLNYGGNLATLRGVFEPISHQVHHDLFQAQLVANNRGWLAEAVIDQLLMFASR